MARSGSEERKASRRRQVGRGIALGTLALGVPALVNAIIARSAAGLPQTTDSAQGAWRSELWPSDEGHIHIRTRNTEPKGSAVLFLHSLGPGHSQQQWIEAAEAASRRHPVVLVDLLGWGESDRPTGTYDLVSCTEQLEALCRDRLTDRFHIVASGESAPIALSLAEALPASVASVALSGPAGLQLSEAAPTAKDWIFDKLLGTPILRTSAVNAYTRRSAIANNLIRHQLAPPSEAQLDEHYRLAHLPGSARPLAAFLRGRYERSLETLAVKRDLKLWIGWGRKAVGEPVEDADLWLRHLEDAELVVFEEAASWPHVDVPKLFVRELLRFLA